MRDAISPERKRSAVGLAALLAVLAALLATAAAGHTWVTAQARAVMVLSTALELPVASGTVDLLTGEPRVEERTVGGVSTVVFEPASEGPHPTMVFVNGAVPLGPEEPAVVRLSEGLARAGYRVLVPDLPGLREGAITEQTATATTAVAREAARDPGTRDGRVGFFGVSVGASLALLSAGEVGDRAVVASGLAPYADLENVVRLATTGTYVNPVSEEEGPFPYHPRQYLGLVVARSLAQELPEEDREVLLSELPPVEEYQPPQGDPPDEPEPDPLDVVRDLSPEEFGPEARSLIRLLSNQDPARFDDLYGELPPELQENIEELSPVTGVEDVSTRLELASAPRDAYFPPSESWRLAHEAPEARVTVTPALSHSGAEISPDDIPAFLELNGFVVRTLRYVASGAPETDGTAAPRTEQDGKAAYGEAHSGTATPLSSSPDLVDRLIYHSSRTR